MELHRNRSLGRAGIAVACLFLTSCEWLAEQRRFNASPQGQALQAQQWGMFSQQMHQQNMQNQALHHQTMQQSRQMQHDYAMRLSPVRVKHSGSLNVNHSGTIRVQR